MNLITEAFTFPAIILPAFVGSALLLAIVLRGQHKPWRYRDIVVALSLVLALYCAGLALWLAPRGSSDRQPGRQEEAGPGIEADMLVSRGNMVELYFNDWAGQPERLPVIAGERHVYRFTKIPREITRLRIDPTDQPDARIVIFGLTVKVGSQIIQQFGPAELKTWQRQNVSPPNEENGGLVMLDTNNDPVLFTAVAIRLPEGKAGTGAGAAAESKSPEWPYFRSLVLALAVLLLIELARTAAGTGRLATLLNRPCPQFPALSPWFARASAGVLVLLVAVGIIYFQQQAAASDIGIEVDMLVSRGNVVELYLNDKLDQPERLPVVAGQRHVYRFTKLPGEVTRVRLDPTDLSSARIEIYSLAVKNNTQIFQQLGPAELKNWQTQNLSPPKEENGGLVLTDLTDDPILHSSVAWRLPGGKLKLLAPLIQPSDSPFLLAITVFLLLLLARMSTRAGRMQAVLIAVISCAACPVAYLVMQIKLLLPPPVTAAVGFAGYVGYPKANEYLAALDAMVICILLSYTLARLAGPDADALEEAPVASRPRHIWIAYAAIFGLLFLNFVPNLMGMLDAMRGAVYQVSGWDEANGLTWAYMVNAGLRPLRDFWYPYSGFYLQLLPFPLGAISSFLQCTIVLWVLFVALVKVTGRRLEHALVIFGLILAPVLLDMLPAWQRYLMALDVALLYVGIYDVRRLEWKTHLPFAAFVGYTFFYEPTLVLYAGVGIAAHIVLTAAGGNAYSTLKQLLVCVGVPMLAGITAALLAFAANGMLPGLWDFERSIGDQGDYGAFPADIPGWVLPSLRPDTVFLLMFLLMSYAVYRWVRLKGRQDDRLGAALIVLGCTTFVAMQKQILRPHGMTQLRLFPYVAVLIFGLIVWRERKPVCRMIIVAFLGCILGIAVHGGLLRGIYQQDIQAAPGKVLGSIDAVLHHRRDFDQVNATLYSRSRFVGVEVQNAVVDNLAQACGLRPEDSVYVLGDYPIFYMLLHQRPPYITNSYNDSPIYEQQKVLDWFHRKNPRFVIWGTDVMGYDNVPHIVRLPLIYTYVVEHYEFVRAIGPFHILAERSPDHPPDLEYWRHVLGNQVNLGAVPGRARLAEYAACGGDVARCDAVLVVKSPHSRPVGSKLTVDVESPGGPFRIQFDVNPKEQEYVVNLNRLWFWNALSKPATPRITAEDGAEAVMDYRRERSPVLY